MGSINPNGQTKEQQIALRKVWEALPVVQEWTERVRTQIEAEKLTWGPEGLTRAFAIAREQGGDELPDSGIRATG